MADEIDVRVSLDLDPEAAMATIVDYDDDTASYLSTAKSAFTEAHTALGAIHDAKLAVAEDPTLNEAGALLKVDDFAQKRMIAKVYPLWDIASASLNEKVQVWEAEMTKGVESKASQMVSSEIRAHFKGLALGERMVAITQAIRDGDDVVASAVLGAPGMLSGIDDEMKQILLREYHEQFNPALAKRLRAVTAARDLINGRVGVLKREAAKAVGDIKVYQPSKVDGRPILVNTITPAQLRAKRDNSNKPFAL